MSDLKISNNDLRQQAAVFEVIHMQPSVPRTLGKFGAASFEAAFHQATADGEHRTGDFIVYRIGDNDLATGHRAFNIPRNYEETINAKGHE